MAGYPANGPGGPGGIDPLRPMMNPQGQPLQPMQSQPMASAGQQPVRGPMQQPARPMPVPQRPVPVGGGPGQPTRPGQPAGARPIPVQKKKKVSDNPWDVGNEEEDEDDEEGKDVVLEEVAKRAPPWLISTLFHTTMVILLGLFVAVQHHQKTTDVAAEIVPPERFAEQLGDQLIDPSILNSVPNPDLGATEQILTPQNLPPVDDPFAAPPKMENIGLSEGPGTTSFSNIDAPMIGLALSGRQSGSKKNQLLGKYGGNATTESSVISGLQWLAKQQKPDGSWSLTGPFKDGGSEENVASATAMALLAFQGQGNTHQTGKFKENVVKGWKFLIKMQEKDGNFVTTGPAHQRLYAQAQCTIALCELYGMTSDSNYRLPAERAVKYAINIQDKKGGGWRYTPGEDSDTSVTGWYVMALQSAKMSKLEVPQAVFDNIMRYLDSAQTDGGKQYTYTPGTFTTAAVTAEGLLCREYLGWKQNDQRLVEGVAALNRNPVDWGSGERDVYYWYYATQACHHMEGKIWNDWNEEMRQEIPEHQVKKGAEAGSWDPEGDKWGSYGGRLYVTCLSIYMLEVYYRHLPIYSGYKSLK